MTVLMNERVQVFISLVALPISVLLVNGVAFVEGGFRPLAVLGLSWPLVFTGRALFCKFTGRPVIRQR